MGLVCLKGGRAPDGAPVGDPCCTPSSPSLGTEWSGRFHSRLETPLGQGISYLIHLCIPAPSTAPVMQEVLRGPTSLAECWVPRRCQIMTGKIKSKSSFLLQHCWARVQPKSDLTLRRSEKPWPQLSPREVPEGWKERRLLTKTQLLLSTC